MVNKILYLIYFIGTCSLLKYAVRHSSRRKIIYIFLLFEHNLMISGEDAFHVVNNTIDLDLLVYI